MFDPDDLIVTMGVCATYEMDDDGSSSDEEEEDDEEEEGRAARRPQDKPGAMVVPESDFNKRLNWLSQQAYKKSVMASTSLKSDSHVCFEDPWLQAGIAASLCPEDAESSSDEELLTAARREQKMLKMARQRRKGEHFSKLLTAARGMAANDNTSLKKEFQRRSILPSKEQPSRKERKSMLSKEELDEKEEKAKGIMEPGLAMDMLVSFDNALAALESAEVAIKAKPYLKKVETDDE